MAGGRWKLPSINTLTSVIKKISGRKIGKAKEINDSMIVFVERVAIKSLKFVCM